MHSHLRGDATIVICCMCRNSSRFYNAVRRNHDDRVFCSLHCSIQAETNIELLMQNDERSHLKILGLKYSNDSDSDDSVDGICNQYFSMQPY